MTEMRAERAGMRRAGVSCCRKLDPLLKTSSANTTIFGCMHSCLGIQLYIRANQ